MATPRRSLMVTKKTWFAAGSMIFRFTDQKHLNGGPSPKTTIQIIRLAAHHLPRCGGHHMAFRCRKALGTHSHCPGHAEETDTNVGALHWTTAPSYLPDPTTRHRSWLMMTSLLDGRDRLLLQKRAITNGENGNTSPMLNPTRAAPLLRSSHQITPLRKGAATRRGVIVTMLSSTAMTTRRERRRRAGQGPRRSPKNLRRGKGKI